MNDENTQFILAMKRYRISVLMGIYNCAQTLPEALDSLLAQTYQGFKVIMCDDGSFDNTYKVAKRYADKYENFILIKNEKNMKLAATLNHCLEYADTEYVARMDGDDISVPNRFETLINFLDSHQEFAFVSSAMSHFDENGIWKVTIKEIEPTKESFRWTSPFCHAPVLMRTAELRAIGNYTTDAKVERMEDYYLWHKFYCAGYKGYNLPDPLYLMRDDKNATRRRRGFATNFRGYKTDVEILRNLGLKRYWFTPTIRFILSSIIPASLKHTLRHIKASIIK